MVNTPDGWLAEHYWPELEQLTEDIARIEHVKRVYGPLSLLKKMNQWHNGGETQYYRLPESGTAARDIPGLLDSANSDQLANYVTTDGKQIRISVLANLQGDLAITALIATIEGITAIGLGLQSRHLLWMSILPNVTPMLIIFILMWLLDITLNAATVMVSSISLGIAVDNTVHFLTRFRKQRIRGESPVVAAQSTIAQVGPSITITTVTACIGFYALAPSAFEPISNLGLLSGSAWVSNAKRPLFAVEKHGGEPEIALAYLNRALELRPEHVQALLFRGVAHTKLGESELAEEDWALAKKLNPNVAGTRERLLDIEV